MWLGSTTFEKLHLTNWTVTEPTR